MNIKTLKGQVENILIEQPVTRDSDIALTIAVWKKYYGVGDTLMVSQLYDLPREDNVKRIRANFNAEGLYLTSNLEVQKRRKQLEEEWHEELGYASPGSNLGLFREDKEVSNHRDPA